MSLHQKELEKLSIVELEALILQKRAGEIDEKKAALKDARAVVAQLEADLQHLTGKAPSARPPRGSIRESILRVLAEKPLSIKEIRQATGIDKISPTLANLKVAKEIKQEGSRGAYFLAKK